MFLEVLMLIVLVILYILMGISMWRAGVRRGLALGILSSMQALVNKGIIQIDPINRSIKPGVIKVESNVQEANN